jgi:ribosomal protein L32E
MNTSAPVQVGDKFRASNGLILEVVEIGYGADRTCRVVQPNGSVGLPVLKVSALNRMERVS